MLAARHRFVWRGTRKPLCDSLVRGHRDWLRRLVCEHLKIQDLVINGAAVIIDGAPTFPSLQLIGGATVRHTAESSRALNLTVRNGPIVNASRAAQPGYDRNSFSIWERNMR